MQEQKRILLAAIAEVEQMSTKISFFRRTSEIPKIDSAGMTIQPWPRFTVMLDGSLELETLNGVVLLEKGSIAVFSPYCYCRTRPGEGRHRILSVVLRNGYLRLVYNEYEAGRPAWPPTLQHHQNTLSSATSYLFNAFSALDAVDTPDQFAPEILSALMKLIRYDLEREEEAQNGKSYQLFLAAADFAEQNYNRQITRKVIGKELHVSISYLSRLFRQYAGTTVYEYQMRIRMLQASTLLKESDLNIGEIAYQCGFQTTSFFIRKFKEYYSATPVQYRLQTASEKRGSINL